MPSQQSSVSSFRFRPYDASQRYERASTIISWAATVREGSPSTIADDAPPMSQVSVASTASWGGVREPEVVRVVPEMVPREDDIDFAQEVEAPGRPFRLSAKGYFVTYSQIGERDNEAVTQFWREFRPEPKWWKAVEETHEDGGRHWHVVVMWNTPLRARRANIFDIEGIHPNIKSIRHGGQNLERLWDYIHKQEGAAVWGTWEGPIAVDMDHKTKRGTWSYIVDSETEAVFRERLRKLDPQSHVLHHDKIEGYVRKAFGKKEDDYEPQFQEYPNLPEAVSEWVNGEMKKTSRPKTLILWGRSRTGKTEWARSLGSHNYFNGLFNLDDFDDSRDYVVFDDIGYDFFPNYKGWLGAQREMVLTDKYRGKRTVKWGKPCIWLHNQDPMVAANNWDKDWLRYNAVIVELIDPLYGELPNRAVVDDGVVYLEDLMHM